MKLYPKLSANLKLIDETATTYLTTMSVILFDEQKEALREACKMLIYTNVNVYNFLHYYHSASLGGINIEDKLFLMEQFENVLHGDAKEQ